MELNISELDDNMYDQIPENTPIKVVKKTNTTVPTKSAIKKVVRPQVPEQKPKISYDEILSKMGMFVSNGQLHLLDEAPIQPKQQQQQYIQPKQQQQQQQQQITNKKQNNKKQLTNK
jgi:hypothetical protein